MRLYHQVQGDGRPFVLLHGFLGSSDNWRAMRKRFAVSYKVISVDLRNHGNSPHSSNMNYAVMAEDLRELLSDQVFSNIFLLGHSIGGKVAMQFAAESPQEVEKLVIVDIAPKAYPPSQRSLLQAIQSLDLRSLKAYSEAEGALAAAIPDTPLRKFVVKNLARNSSGEFRWRIALESLVKNYDRLIEPLKLPSSFAKPTYFIRGGLSKFIDDQDFAPIRERFPHAEFHTIANAGHWVHVDAPEEFYHIVDEYLSRS